MSFVGVYDEKLSTKDVEVILTLRLNYWWI